MALILNKLVKALPLLLALCFFLSDQELSAQAPDSINYQAVARNDKGEVLPNTGLSVRISVLSGPSGGNLVYEEEHTGISTNQFGLFNLHIGGGTQIGGSAASFDAIAWGSSDHHIEVAIDAGSGYESLGRRKFVSVPYALYADSSGSGGGAADLQSAYEGGNTITVDTATGAPGPLLFQNGSNQSFFYGNGYHIGVGTTVPIENVRMDVEYDGVNGPGPGILVASAPTSIPNSVYDRPFFKQVHSGLLGVGAGSGRSIGVSGFTTHRPLTAAAQDSIYGMTGIANDQEGAMAAVGVSGISQAHTDSAQRAVGVFGMVDDQIVTDYKTNPVLAGGVFDANIDPGHTALDSTIGVVGLSGYGGDNSVGVYGVGRGDPGAVVQNTYGVLGQAGVAPDTNVGVMGKGRPGAAGLSLAAWFKDGKTLIQDTLQVNYGSPVAGEVLTAVDNQGNAVWDTVPAGGTPITLQSAYDNGNSISLASGSPLRVSNSSNAHHFLYASNGDSALAIGHQQPINIINNSAVSLHVSNAGNNPGQMVISAGSASATDAMLALSENIGGTASGGEIRWSGVEDQLVLGGQIGGGQPMIAIQGGPSFDNGVLIGGGYAGSYNDPPTNGLLVEDTVGIGTQNPQHKHHIVGRTFSRDGMLVHDTAHYRYDQGKVRYEGYVGSDLRPSAGASSLGGTNSYYEVNPDGHAYFVSGLGNPGVISAPLNLPTGAVVDSISYYVYDASTGNVDLTLERVPYGGTTAPSVVSGTNVSSSGNGGAQTVVGDPANPLVIDNGNNAYRLKATFPTGAGSNLRLANIKVHYTVHKAD